MPLEQFRESDRDEVLRIREETFAGLRLDSFRWQPCTQTESLEKDCAKFVFREGGTLLAYAAAYALDETHFRLNLVVSPSHTSRGIGTLLLDAVEAEARRAGGEYLQARLLEGTPAGLRFALARGFVEVHRMRGMSLRAGDFSFAAWRELGERLAAEGFTVTTMRDESEAGRVAALRLAELHRDCQEGWPSPDPTWMAERNDLHLSLFTNVAAPGLLSIMKRGASYVGYTSCARENASGTAVHPDFRGLGVATYLKACNLRRCIEGGEDYFETCSANPAMMRVNERLGYRFNGLAEVRLLKRL